MKRPMHQRYSNTAAEISGVSDLSDPLPSISDAPFVPKPEADPGLSKGRYRRMATATVAGVVGKGTSLLVSLAIVPVTVRYLGPERYGLWVAISSSILMFFLLDIGIANTLTNLISEAYAASDRNLAAKYFATGLWMVTGVSALIGLSLWLAWPHIHWDVLFRIRGDVLIRETSQAFAAAVIVLLFALPTNLISRVLAGYQELHIANLFTAGGNVLSFLAVLAVIHLHGSLAALVTGYAGATVIANTCCLLWVCIVSKPWLKPWPTRIDWTMTTKLLHTGGQFFVLQMAGLVVFNSDNLILAHYLNPIAVTQYSVTWRVAGFISAIQALVIPSLWPAYAEAWVRRDMVWIRTTYYRMRWATLAAVALACAILLPAGRTIIRIWAGAGAVPSAGLLYLMCGWMIVLAITMNQACLMGATYHLRTQTISSCTAAAVNLGLSIWWVRRLGSEGVILGTLVSYVLFILFVQAREVRSILNTTPGEQPT
jgi:O-antigen/teichoic acid export membrane protein